MSKAREPIMAVIVATVFPCVVIGLCALVTLQAQSSSATPVSASTTFPASEDSALDLRLVFLGYPKIGVPQSGGAIISENGLSDIHDITFSQIGGELSPNGRFIAYDSCSNTNRGIYLADPNGSRPQMVICVGGNYCVDIRWSPDSAKFSYTNPRDRSLHVFDIAVKSDTLIPNIQDADWHWWSPAGNEIVYGWRARGQPVGPDGRLLYITDLRGNSRQLTFTRDFVTCDRESNRIDTWAPAWSPNGDTIAFTQCGRLFVVSPAGNDLTQLTTPRYASRPSPEMPVTSAYSPRWSPDGRWIIFIGDNDVLKRISADGNKIVAIGKLPYWGGPFSIAPFNK